MVHSRGDVAVAGQPCVQAARSAVERQAQPGGVSSGQPRQSRHLQFGRGEQPDATCSSPAVAVPRSSPASPVGRPSPSQGVRPASRAAACAAAVESAWWRIVKEESRRSCSAAPAGRTSPPRARARASSAARPCRRRAASWPASRPVERVARPRGRRPSPAAPPGEGRSASMLSCGRGATTGRRDVGDHERVDDR